MVLQLRSLLKSTGELELSLADVPAAQPADNEVVVRVEATPYTMAVNDCIVIATASNDLTLPATAAGLPRSGHLADHVPGEAQPASRAAPARVASASAPRVNVGV